jgi:mRNA-degrading endonuclease RelE of RelBE toxin-antitoxin system
MQVLWQREAAGEAGAEYNRAQAALERVLDRVYTKTQQVQGWAGIRKLRVGDHRLFFTIIDDTIYVLAYLPRDACYKEKDIVMRRKP